MKRLFTKDDYLAGLRPTHNRGGDEIHSVIYEKGWEQMIVIYKDGGHMDVHVNGSFMLHDPSEVDLDYDAMIEVPDEIVTLYAFEYPNSTSGFTSTKHPDLNPEMQWNKTTGERTVKRIKP
jgi:hypothetical protein